MNRILISTDEMATWAPSPDTPLMDNDQMQVFLQEAMKICVACNTPGPNPDALVLLTQLGDGTRMFMTWEPAAPDGTISAAPTPEAAE